MQFQLTPGERDRFWSHVDRSGGIFACWPWLLFRDRDGYGYVRLRHRSVGAHRVAWSICNGPIPIGLHVLHRCDNPPCCNPAHLWVGSQLENNTDARLKRRSAAPVGEESPHAKLSAEKVREMRRRYAAGTVTQAALARECGVRHSLIWAIIHGRLWRHVDET